MARAVKRKASAKSPAPKITFTADEIVLRKVEDLIVFPNNPKIHTPDQVEAIATNIKEFGFDQPILIDEKDTILKGHGRQLAARKAGLALVPTIVRSGLSAADKWAIVISDNALPAMTSFDKGLLRIGLTTLAKLDYPLHLTGFDNVRLATFMPGANGATSPDEQPKLEEAAVSRKGDVWILGDHVLHCADCTKVKIAEVPRLQLADPPYELETEGAGVISRKQNYSKKMAAAGVDNFDVATIKLHAKTNVFFTSKALVPTYLDRAIELDVSWDLNILHRSAAMPNNSGHLMTDLDYLVLMGSMAPARGLEFANYSKLLSLSNWERPVPWAKPVDILTKYIRLFSAAGDLVFDPYCGSGSTIIACAVERRRCFGIEINPLFVDLSVRRWEKWANVKATLQGTKKTFDQIQKERSKAAA